MKFTNVLALSLLLPLILAKKPKCIDQMKNKITLSCRRGGVIYKPNVEEDQGTCNDKSCHGLSPETLRIRNNCYWNRSCVLQMQQVPMVTRCFGVPKSLTVHNGYCIPKYEAVMIDICKETRMDSIHNKTMMIRSHPHYPWNYDHLTFNIRGDEPKNCRITSSVRAADVGKMTLAVTVDDVDIDEDMDNLWIQYGSSKYEIKQKETFAIALQEFSDISLVFRTNGSHPFYPSLDITDPSLTKGGRGFIICLRVLPQNDFDGTKSVCDGVIKKGMRIRARSSQRRRRKNNPRKKKDRKGKGKKKRRKNKKAVRG